MITKNELINNLCAMNLKSTDTVIVHSSMKKIGDVDANLVIDALIEYFKDGLLLIPTHTWKNINQDNPVYDYKDTPSCIGIIPNLFLKRDGVFRSLHPTHSVAAIGADAKEFIKDEEFNTSPCSPSGVYDRLRERNAKVLLIGVGLERCTFIHSVEEVLNIPNRLANYPMHLKIKLEDNKTIDSYMRKHYNQNQPHISEDFVKLNEAMLNKNAMYSSKFGNADVLVGDTNKMFKLIRYILRKDPECIVNNKKIDEEYWTDYEE